MFECVKDLKRNINCAVHAVYILKVLINNITDVQMIWRSWTKNVLIKVTNLQTDSNIEQQ